MYFHTKRFIILLVIAVDVYADDGNIEQDFSMFSLDDGGGSQQGRAGTMKKCRDKMGNCYNYKKYCDTYTTILSTYCPVTCNKCPAPPPTPIAPVVPKASPCGNAPRRTDGSSDKLIVSGKDAKQGHYPWQVAIYSDSVFLCGGSLIDKNHVLSAAHCFAGSEDKPQLFKITLGTHNRMYPIAGIEQTVRVKRITTHAQYNRATVVNDIAILQLSSEAKFSNYIRPICLPDEGEARAVSSACHVTGWGKQYAGGDAVPILQEITYPIVSPTKCKSVNDGGGRRITEGMICAGIYDGYSFQSACHGDSGGPLSCKDETSGKWKLFGIVSWGSTTCNALEKFNVFTKVSQFIPWIKKNTAN